jgi:hypothetical protein
MLANVIICHHSPLSTAVSAPPPARPRRHVAIRTNIEHNVPMVAVQGAAGGKGKSGGARVIYYFHADDMPVFLLTAFGKSEQANLTQAERNAARDLVAMLVSSYRK